MVTYDAEPVAVAVVAVLVVVVPKTTPPPALVVVAAPVAIWTVPVHVAPIGQHAMFLA